MYFLVLLCLGSCNLEYVGTTTWYMSAYETLELCKQAGEEAIINTSATFNIDYTCVPSNGTVKK